MWHGRKVGPALETWDPQDSQDLGNPGDLGSPGTSGTQDLWEIPFIV